MDQPTKGFSTTKVDATAPASELARELKTYLRRCDRENVSLDVGRHYQRLRLFDSSGALTIRALEPFACDLIAQRPGWSEVDAFLDRVARAADENSYLRRMLEKIDWRRFPGLLRKVEEEGEAIIPDVVSFAMALDRLTGVVRRDFRLLLPLLDHWENERKAIGMDQQMTMFWRVKRASVKYPLEKMVRIHEVGNFPRGFLSLLLPLNILEAAAADLCMGNNGNARAGWTLARNGLSKRGQSKKESDSAVTWSEDRKTFRYDLPMPAKWADLYTSWNLSFISSFRDFPYAFAKLLIPSVSAYRGHPQEYLYNRKLALFIYIYYSGFYRTDKAKQGEQVMDWSDRSFSRFWGRVNRESASNYEADLRERDRS